MGRTPNPNEKMPNKWWKKRMNDWRKALHAFDPLPPSQINANKNAENGKQDQKENLINFCCEKCTKEFIDFDEWQTHRQVCQGKVEKVTKEKIERKNDVSGAVNAEADFEF